MVSPKRILICPLNWGLGHATRCIPIIRLLLQKNAEVLIAADGRALALLKQEFPQLTFIEFKGYDINYSDKIPMGLQMMLSAPKLIRGIRREHVQLNKIIEEYRIDTVISDNRYGCWSKKVKSIFITHQLMIKTPVGEKLLHNLVLHFVKKYDECWIPDTAEHPHLSGDLAHKYDLLNNTFFVGALSRFTKQEQQTTVPTYDAMAIVSGPEPQRSVFEKIVLDEFKKNKIKGLIVCGKTELNQSRERFENIEVINHLNANEMQEAILKSSVIVARSGYSTIMDLATLRKKAVFIPTPGQTEQEYLATLLAKHKIAGYQPQQAFNFKQALKELDDCSGFHPLKPSNELKKRIDSILN